MSTSAKRLTQLREEAVPAAGEFWQSTADVVAPWVEAAEHTVGAAWEKASTLAHQAVAKGAPLAQQAVERGVPLARQVVTRAKADVPAPVSAPSKKRGRGLAVAAVVAAAAAGAYVVARRLLGDRAAQWQTARPSAPYVPPTSASTPDDAGPADPGDSTDPVKDTTDRESPVPPAALASATAEESSPADDASAGPDAPVSTSEDNATGVGPDAHPTLWSDQGAYVGTEPPEGFTIKANERSMKYHLPESSGYTRTLSEIWFDSEDKAQAAGFVRAQR